jgi:uncharacterized RDD family membrane protein YckC
MPSNFCPHCGAKLQYQEAEICPTCGMRIKEPPQPEEEKYAGVWDRFAAYFIDFLVGIAIFIVILVPGYYFAPSELVFPGFIISLVLYWLYFAYSESSSHQATLGKRFLKIKVTDANGQPIHFPKSLGRSFFKLLFTISPFSLLALINAVVIYYSDENKGIHDYIFNTRVLKQVTLMTKA